MELFPPIVAHVMLVLVGVLSMVSLVGLAYNWTMIINVRKQFHKVSELEKTVGRLTADVRELRGRLAEEQLKDAVPLTAEMMEKMEKMGKMEELHAEAEQAMPPGQREVWQDFLDDYNSLAASMHVPKAEQACQSFAASYKLEFLVCVSPAAEENGQKAPKFAAVNSLQESTYWAWPVEAAPGAYVVVPNPLVPYNQKLHTEAGMKETFASDYKQGTAESLQVRLPAKFQNQGGNWKIVQPGVIRVK